MTGKLVMGGVGPNTWLSNAVILWSSYFVSRQLSQNGSSSLFCCSLLSAPCSAFAMLWYAQVRGSRKLNRQRCSEASAFGSITKPDFFEHGTWLKQANPHHNDTPPPRLSISHAILFIHPPGRQVLLTTTTNEWRRFVVLFSSTNPACITEQAPPDLENRKEEEDIIKVHTPTPTPSYEYGPLSPCPVLLCPWSARSPRPRLHPLPSKPQRLHGPDTTATMEQWRVTSAGWQAGSHGAAISKCCKYVFRKNEGQSLWRLRRLRRTIPQRGDFCPSALR
ncbi:hypothetical protein V8C37DRAFT_5670 [Trichoderma ceciliae]